MLCSKLHHGIVNMITLGIIQSPIQTNTLNYYAHHNDHILTFSAEDFSIYFSIDLYMWHRTSAKEYAKGIRSPTVDQKVDQKVDKKLGQKVDKKLDKKLDKKVDQKVDQKVDKEKCGVDSTLNKKYVEWISMSPMGLRMYDSRL